MDKSTKNRASNWEENKKSAQNPHLSDQQLLLALDGELSVQEAAQVEIHIASCWTCRAHREHIEKAIGDVVDYRDHLIQPYLSSSSGARPRFIDQLEQLAARIGQPPLWKRVLDAPWRLWAISQVAVPRYVWIGVPVVAILALLTFTHLGPVSKVAVSHAVYHPSDSQVQGSRHSGYKGLLVAGPHHHPFPRHHQGDSTLPDVSHPRNCSPRDPGCAP
jgi:anti-sigma factor RsiW